jgi:hypothetical protein
MDLSKDALGSIVESICIYPSKRVTVMFYKECRHLAYGYYSKIHGSIQSPAVDDSFSGFFESLVESNWSALCIETPGGSISSRIVTALKSHANSQSANSHPEELEGAPDLAYGSVIEAQKKEIFDALNRAAGRLSQRSHYIFERILLGETVQQIVAQFGVTQLDCYRACFEAQRCLIVFMRTEIPEFFEDETEASRLMADDEFFTPKMLMDYCEGTLCDPDAIANIGSSYACKRWLREYRLVRIFARCIECPDQSQDTEPDEWAEDEADGSEYVSSAQVLDPDEFGSNYGFPSIVPQAITNFVAENLPPEEMLEIENALAIDDGLLDDYLAQRVIFVAEEGPKPPEELDNLVLDLIRASAV